MQTNNVALLALLSVPALFAAHQSAIPLKIRTPVPPGIDLVSDVAFVIPVTLDSSIGDIRTQLVAAISACADQQPTCLSCSKCMYIRTAQALQKKNKNFVFFFDRLKPIETSKTVAQLRLMGLTEDHSLAAIQSPHVVSPVKEKAEIKGSESLKPIPKTRTRTSTST